MEVRQRSKEPLHLGFMLRRGIGANDVLLM